ncbi:unnamed protein product [Acanthosepion pharaonis]|uniref:Uncharacterized protein n=1 Tax=Acanthosepion pharaonis TaxID=158019 RepID=A0A812ANT8_ACAPH|nr:unnamed protein product [Sepia pharaonis]
MKATVVGRKKNPAFDINEQTKEVIKVSRKRFLLDFVLLFIFVSMAKGENATEVEPSDLTGVWKSSRGAFLKIEELPSEELSAVLFLKSKGFFNLTGMKSPATENGTFYLNTAQSSYTVGIAGQFLICNNGIEQLQVALLLGINANCDFDVFSRNSIHTFIRVDDTRKLTGIYHTKHERAEGTSGGGIESLHGWKGDNSLFTISMIWNRGTSVTTLLGIRRYNIDEGMCILWTDFALIVAQDTCTTSWQFCIFSSYNTWKKLW